MAAKEKLIEDLDYLSTTVSERSRVIALGIVAIWWAALIGKESVSGLAPQSLMGPVFLAAASILLDLLQYMSGYMSSLLKLREVERKKLAEFKFDRTSFFYRLRGLCFYLKQLSMLAGLVWLITILWPLALK